MIYSVWQGASPRQERFAMRARDDDSRIEKRLPYTPEPWSLPHYFQDDTPCNCKYIFSEWQAYMGSICEIDVDNGKPIGEGGNDGPPYEEALANAKLIVQSPAMARVLRACISESAVDGKISEETRAEAITILQDAGALLVSAR